MAFPPAFLDEIRERMTVSSVIGRRVRLVRAGREFKGLCPFHNEKTPSFTVNDDKGFFHCFGCGAHGDVIGFAMRADNLSFPDAVERLAGEAGLAMPEQTPAERARAERAQTLHDVVEAACVWFEKQLAQPAGRPGLDYLKGRGLDGATIARFRLGYAPDGRMALKTALVQQGFAEKLLIEAGLLVAPEGGGEPFDFFRGRVIFPIMDRRGRPIAFGGRVLGDGQPKYLNSRDTPLFDKGRTLYALDKAREGVRLGADLLVAEGYMDVIALHVAGFTGAVAPLGTAVTEAQIEALWKLAPEPILCLDGDAAGQRAALRAAERALPLLRPGLSLRFAILPAGEDPDSLIRHRGPTAVAEVLRAAKPLADVIWEAETAGRPVDTPERRAALEARLKERLRVIADRSVQNHYFQLLVRQRLWDAFRPARRFTPGRGRPAAALRSAGDVDALLLRQAAVFLATFINHPVLIGEESETLAGIDLPSGELDRIRGEILNVAAAQRDHGHTDLDSQALKDHLSTKGLAAVTSTILQPSLYNLWPFSSPDAGVAAARAGLKHLMELSQRRRIEGEVDAAQRNLEVDMTEANWARLDGLQQQIRHAGEPGGDFVDTDEEPLLASETKGPVRHDD